MTKRLARRLFGLFTGALLGYLWGWVWGWSLFDPNSDRWALAAAIVALAGLLCGATTYLWRYGELLLSLTFGLYLSWLARTALFGDIPGGPGIFLMAGGVVISGVVGLRVRRRASRSGLAILLGALYTGFFGGFFIDVVLMDKVLNLTRTHSILSQAPAVLACGLIGGIVVARRSTRPSPGFKPGEDSNQNASKAAMRQ
ncbi:MAG: hypothetical protein HY870_09690 [Chloroflexi bacterium]|nr:hypothetical protein [Chloroflexota bacterium]